MSIPSGLVVTHVLFWILSFWFIYSVRSVCTTVERTARRIEAVLPPDARLRSLLEDRS